MKKKASQLKTDDVVVDHLGFLRTVWYIITVPAKVVGWVVTIFFKDDDYQEIHNWDNNVEVLRDENEK